MTKYLNNFQQAELNRNGCLSRQIGLLCYNKCTCINIKLTFVLLNLDISRFWKQLIIKLLSSADNIHEQLGVRSGPSVCLVLIWIHTIWHLDFFPEISWKYLFWKESADDNKITKSVACKDLYKKFNAVWSGTIFFVLWTK